MDTQWFLIISLVILTAIVLLLLLRFLLPKPTLTYRILGRRFRITFTSSDFQECFSDWLRVPGRIAS